AEAETDLGAHGPVAGVLLQHAVLPPSGKGPGRGEQGQNGLISTVWLAERVFCAHPGCIRVLLLVSNDLVIRFCCRQLHRRQFRRLTAHRQSSPPASTAPAALLFRSAAPIAECLRPHPNLASPDADRARLTDDLSRFLPLRPRSP